MTRKLFINRRRKGSERREESDPCKDLSIDVYHRKRRKNSDRREERTLDEDYYAFLSSKKNDKNDLTDSNYH